MATIVAVLGTEIKGNSNQPGYENQVSAFAIKHDIQRPIAWDGTTTSGSSRHGALIITRYVDQSSPKIYQACSQSYMIPESKVLIYQQAEAGELDKFMIINLKNVYISRISLETKVTTHPQTGELTESIIEHVSLHYAAIHWNCESMIGVWDIERSPEGYNPQPEIA